MKLAAIDIGSNGARLLISSVLIHHSNKDDSHSYSLKDVEYVRFPLRLGKDVFDKQVIGKKKEAQILKLMQAYKLLMELHEVEDYMAVATSAFREAENRDEIVSIIRRDTGLEIEVIDGEEEARILQLAIRKNLSENKNYLHIDVGGGSTELNLYLSRQVIASYSFPVGSIRYVSSDETEDMMLEMQLWLKKEIKNLHNKRRIIAIGTGGNINKLASLTSKKQNQAIRADELKTIVDYLASLSLDELINEMEFNPDRADTIVPASRIYLNVMKWVNCQQIIVPKLGLKDGIVEFLLKKNEILLKPV